jgi:hypothetical protein
MSCEVWALQVVLFVPKVVISFLLIMMISIFLAGLTIGALCFVYCLLTDKAWEIRFAGLLKINDRLWSLTKDVWAF